MTRKEVERIGELAAKLTRLQDLDPEIVSAANSLWVIYVHNRGFELISETEI